MKNKLLILLLGAFIPLGAFAQITYLADTAFTTDIGYGGAPACHKPIGVFYRGWQMGRAQSTWLADVFTVPTGSSWTFDTVIVYGIQAHSGTGSTFVNCNLQIYDGTPGLGGTVVWGDTSTNVLVSTGFTGIYSVDTITGPLSNVDPIMYLKLYLSPPATLSTGTYWLSWSAAGSLSGIPFSPDKVLPGRIDPPYQKARQLYGGVWDYINDSGLTIGMNMIIKASASVLSTPNINGKSSFVLNQNIPNPFNGVTNISFYLPEESYTRLSVYNAIGQLVNTLVDAEMNAGEHEVTFSASNLPDGIYFYQLKTNAGVECRQMQILHSKM